MADLAVDKTHLILVNAVVVKDKKVLISQRSWEETHEPGRWTIPGGKVEKTRGNVWNVIEKTLAAEVLEETGVRIHDEAHLLANNTFIRSTGQHVVALIFLCYWKSGIARPLEDTIDVRWTSEKELKGYAFPPNVRDYIKKGFQLLKKKKLASPVRDRSSDTHWMQIALNEAAKGNGLVPGRPLVGCVLVDDQGRKISTGFFKKIGGPHAEIVALKKAGKRARGSTMYVTLEPHCIQGLTPPCTKAIIKAGVKRVFVAMEDPFPGIQGRGVRELEKAGVLVEIGLKRKEAESLNKQWIHKQAKQ
jgi:pyrimidine deaminase RibD-like protein/8-oxo-dGTP pyrophosphatase MutT (NUDIX family)